MLYSINPPLYLYFRFEDNLLYSLFFLEKYPLIKTWWHAHPNINSVLDPKMCISGKPSLLHNKYNEQMMSSISCGDLCFTCHIYTYIKNVCIFTFFLGITFLIHFLKVDFFSFCQNIPFIVWKYINTANI